MDHLDKLIPLIALVAVGGVLLILVRLAQRQRRETPPVAIPAPPVALPISVPVAEPVVFMQPAQAAPAAVPIETLPVERQSASSPVDDVLQLLADKDSLAKAFLLREILAPPVSLRKSKSHR